MLGNLKGIRDAAFAQVDWAPTQSTNAKVRMNELTNRGLQAFASEAPFAFFQRKSIIVCQGDYISGVGDTLSRSSSDPWTFECSLASPAWAGEVLLTAGQMLCLYLADGTERHFRIRTTGYIPAGLGVYVITVEQPAMPFFPDFSEDGISPAQLSYRIYREGYYLPAEAVTINRIRIRSERYTYVDLEPKTHPQEGYGLTYTGVPRWFARLSPMSLPAPLMAPTVAASGSWGSDLERSGTFEVCATICWGKRDWANTSAGPVQNVNGSRTTVADPLWESLPSPVSASIAAGTSGVEVTMPDLDLIQGFGDSGDMRYGLSGWYYRIYRKRTAISGATGSAALETSQRFYLLGEMDRNGPWSMVFNSSDVPDYQRPLTYTEQFQAIGLYPRPDQRYELEVEGIFKPDLLVDDSDPVDVQDGVAMEALLDRIRMMVYEMQGNWGAHAVIEARYNKALRTLRNRYGMIQQSQGFRRGRADAMSYRWDQPIRRVIQGT